MPLALQSILVRPGTSTSTLLLLRFEQNQSLSERKSSISRRSRALACSPLCKPQLDW